MGVQPAKLKRTPNPGSRLGFSGDGCRADTVAVCLLQEYHSWDCRIPRKVQTNEKTPDFKRDS